MPHPSRSYRKSIIALVATLLIGVLLGAAMTGLAVRHRLEQARALTHADGFVEIMIDTVKPTSPDQEAALREILERGGRDMEKILQAARADIYKTIDQIELEMSEHISEEQLEAFRTRRNLARSRFEGTASPAETLTP